MSGASDQPVSEGAPLDMDGTTRGYLWPKHQW